jgi:predicted transcriptional regulator
MSKSLSSLKNRRVSFNEPPPPPVNSCSISSSQSQNPSLSKQIPSDNMSKGLTLPQVIQIVDQRLTILEKYVNENRNNVQQTENKSNTNDTLTKEENNNILSVIENSIKDIVIEFDKRYELLAEEIGNLKEIVLNLQSYTMGVNKMLIEERARIFAEIQEHTNEHQDNEQPSEVSEVII